MYFTTYEVICKPASYWCKHSLQVNFLELSVVHRLVDVYVPSLRVNYNSRSSAKFQAKLLASVMKGVVKKWAWQ